MPFIWLSLHERLKVDCIFIVFNPKCETIGKNTKKYSQKLIGTNSGNTRKQFFEDLCYVPYQMAFIWCSPLESTCLFGSENIYQAKIRRIGPELHVLNNVRDFPWTQNILILI